MRPKRPVQPDSPKQNKPHDESSLFSALGLASRLGFTIALPAVVCAISGRSADTALGTSPLLLIVGLFCSLVISSFLVYREIKKINLPTT